MKRAWWAVICLFVVACGDDISHPEATGAISGRVLLSGEDEHGGAVVTLSGPGAGTAVTARTGGYRFDGLADGAYILTAAASSTEELSRTASVTVIDGGTALVDDLIFTPLGEVVGRATREGGETGNGGIIVLAVGTGLASVTDDTGHYRIRRIPTGEHEVVATVEGFTPASTSVSVGHGQAATAPQLDLAEKPGSGSAVPILGSMSVAPSVARAGDEVTITFAADRPVATCVASVGGQGAACAAPAGETCTCTFEVETTTPEGTAFVLAVASDAAGSGSTGGVVQIDRTAPSIDASRFELVRRPVGELEQLAALAGGVAEPGPAYAAQATTEIRVWDAASEGNLLRSIVPAADGSVPAASLPDSDGGAPDRLAPVAVWVSAVDLPGNESARVLVTQGWAPSPPAPDGSLMTITRRAVGEPDGLAGAAGALASVCAIDQVTAHDASGGGAVVGTTAGELDGSFGEIPVGTAAASIPRLWISATDKCGREGPRGEALVGQALTGPSTSGGSMVITRRAIGQIDGLHGEAGALSSVCALGEVTAYTASSGGSAIGTVAGAADGSFGEIPVGGDASSIARLWVSAADKCGLVGARGEALVGRALAGPAADGELLAFTRRPIGQIDELGGEPGALSSVCALGEVTAFTAPSGGSAVGTAEGGADGGFGAIAVGTGTESLGRIWVSGSDKCGLTGARAEAVVARDVSSPVIARDQLTYLSRPAGMDDELAGSVGAVTDATSAVREVRIYAAPSGGSPLATVVPDASGQFGTVSVGQQDGTRLYIEAVDKVGLQSARLAARNIQATLTLDGRTPHDASVTPVALFAAAVDGDPRDASPGLVVGMGHEATGADSAAAAAIDAARASLTAGPADDAVAAGWAELAETRPPARYYHAMAYDAGRDRVVLFGGYNNVGYLDDTWEYDPTARTWASINASPRPPATRDCAMVYDPAREVIVLHGGNTSGNQTWQYDGAAWTNVTVSGAPSRYGHAMAYDAARGRIVLFGGRWSGRMADTWEYDGASWTQVATTNSPSPRDAVRMAYDAARQEIVLFGGQTDSAISSETWAYDGADWARLEPVLAPSARSSHVMAYDATRARIVLTGGNSGDQTTWEFDGTNWQQNLATPLPQAGQYSAMAYVGDGETVLFGGSWSGLSDTTWRYDGTRWRSLTPAPRHRHAIAYDAERGRTVLFGGNIYTGATQETWVHDGTGWVELEPSSAPSARTQHAMAYDARRDRVVLFGGNTGGNETWEFDGTEWARISTPVAPWSRYNHAMAYDAARGRIVLFGGSNGVSDTWEYDGSTWTRVFTATPPSVRQEHAMVYDARRGRIVMFGGQWSGVRNDETWVYDGVDWTRLSPAASPAARSQTAMAYDASRGRVLLFGGSSASGDRDDLWSFDGSTWSQVTSLPRPTTRRGHAMVWDSLLGRTLLVGGTNSLLLDDSWAFAARDAGPRTTTHAVSVPLDPEAELTSLTATYVGTGAGDGGGAWAPGVELLVWRWDTASWTSLGAHDALEAAAAAARTIAASLLADVDAHARRGQIWLLAAPTFASSSPPGAIECELDTDAVWLEVSYTIP